MKKTVSIILIIIAIFTFTGCGNTNKVKDESIDIEIVNNKVEKVKEYTDTLFIKHMESEHVSTYKIKQTHYGFITDDPLIILVGYEYVVDNSEYLYGYKLKLNDNSTFTLIEESESIGKFIMR